MIEAIETEHLAQLLAKYDVHGPRYTSYPTALQFDDHFTYHDYVASVQASNQLPVPKPLSLYVHIPFCRQLCYYCGCHKVVTQQTSRADAYLEALYHEMQLRAADLAEDRLVQQIHLGGGTPTYLSDAQIRELLEVLAQNFHLGLPDELELAIEIDPRTVDAERMQKLVRMGFNRISLGVQDFDPAVQEAINRQQSVAQVHSLTQAAREAGVHSVSFDLIYGLPQQSCEGFARTLDAVLAMRPDRIALYNYAHMPQRIPAQRLIAVESLPSSQNKLHMFSAAITTFTQAGYRYIGMDHFALPDDRLCKALDEGSLQRNFQGYSTHADCDVLGFGASAISRIDDSYMQNMSSLAAYRDALAKAHVPLAKGLRLSADDRLRADVIMTIMCSGEVNYADFSQRHDVFFRQTLREELSALQEFAADGLISMNDDGFRVLPPGRLLLRNIAMVFDAYLQRSPLQDAEHPRYSKTL